jgi:anti-anti-sigma regulatory factor
MGSSGIGELVRQYVSVVKSGGTMKVVGLATKVEETLLVTQLYQVFPEFAYERTAIQSIKSAGGLKNRPEKERSS